MTSSFFHRDSFLGLEKPRNLWKFSLNFDQFMYGHFYLGNEIVINYEYNCNRPVEILSQSFFENLFAQNTFVDKKEDFTKQKKNHRERRYEGRVWQKSIRVVNHASLNIT